MRKSAFRRSSLQWQIADRLRHILLRNMRRKRNKWSSLTETWPAVCTVWFNPVYFYCTAGIHLLKRLHISEEAKSIHWEVSVKECLKGTHACWWFFKCILNRILNILQKPWMRLFDIHFVHPCICPLICISNPHLYSKMFFTLVLEAEHGQKWTQANGGCADVTWLDEVSSGE